MSAIDLESNTHNKMYSQTISINKPAQKTLLNRALSVVNANKSLAKVHLMIKYCLILLLCTFDSQAFDCSSPQLDVSVIECESISDLYRALEGDSSSIPEIIKNQFVDPNDATVCDANFETKDEDLIGIFCSQGTSITSIDFGGMNLSGFISADIGNFDALIILRLSSNQLTMSIPTEIGQLSNLVSLVLGRNQLSGPLPVELGNLTNLRYLYLSNNQFSGSLLPSLGVLSDLIVLRINENQLSGQIPPELGQLSNLRELDLADNDISGSIATLTTINSLRIIRLQNNQLDSALPTTLSDMTNLSLLNLNNNRIPGHIPLEITTMASLNYLWLRDNDLIGSIPPEMGLLEQTLLSLNLGNNRLTGPIPQELSQLNLMNFLVLDNNLLSGSIPEDLSNISWLFTLDLSGNLLSGEIPSKFNEFERLTSLYINDNNLSGPVPDLTDTLPLTGTDFLAIQNNCLLGFPDTSQQMIDWLDQRTIPGVTGTGIMNQRAVELCDTIFQNGFDEQ